ncbi:GNAT family N-acetyltransferase [Candidatus Latescibacterota bacterium]
MKIIDLTEEYEKTFFVCFEDWSDEMKEAKNHKEIWYNKMKDKGLRVKLALDDNGVAGGMIQYLPIEQSSVEGKDQYFINCIWVHGHKQGIGNIQKKGMGSALIQAAGEDARNLDAKGIAAWGIILPFWMKASWFKKYGFKRVDRIGFQALMWKPFTDDAVPPRLIREKKKPEPVPGKVKVTAFINGWCPAQNIVFERAKRASAEFGDKVIFEEINTSDRDVFLEWGILDGLYIDKKQVNTGPPPEYKKIVKLIGKRVRKIS